MSIDAKKLLEGTTSLSMITRNLAKRVIELEAINAELVAALNDAKCVILELEDICSGCGSTTNKCESAIEEGNRGCCPDCIHHRPLTLNKITAALKRAQEL